MDARAQHLFRSSNNYAAFAILPIALIAIPFIFDACHLPTAFTLAAAASTFTLLAALAVLARTSAMRQRLNAVIRAQEVERRRWARELHDETLQNMVVLRQRVAQAQTAADLGTARAVLASINTALTQHTAALRHLITDLRPAALDDLGLQAALAALARRTANVEAVSVDVEITGDTGDRLDREAEVAVYRVAQESVTNALKHGRATNIRVQLDLKDGAATLTITDNGAGFEPRNHRTAGYGILGMTERTAALDGDLRIQSGRSGTRVQANFPRVHRLDRAERAAQSTVNQRITPTRIVTLDQAMWAARWFAAIYIFGLVAISTLQNKWSVANLVGGFFLVVAMVVVNLATTVATPRASGAIQVIGDAAITLAAATVLQIDGSDAAWLGLPIVAAESAIRFNRKQAALTSLLIVLAFTAHLVYGMTAATPRSPSVDLATAYTLTVATTLIVFISRSGLDPSAFQRKSVANQSDR